MDQTQDAQVHRLKIHMTEKSQGFTGSWLWGTRGRGELMVTVRQASFLADRGATEVKNNDRKQVRL